MERELFSWQSWDGDESCTVFYDVVLKKQIGKFPPGREFVSAIIQSSNAATEHCILQLFNRMGQKDDLVLVAEFKLHYQVGDQIN